MNNIVKEILMLIIFVTAFIITFKIIENNNIQSNIKKFNNGESLDCGLIVNNIDWKLVDNNLINKNLAGHLDIKYCK